MRVKLRMVLGLVAVLLIGFALLAAYRLKNPDTLTIGCNGIRHVAHKKIDPINTNHAGFHAVQQSEFEGRIVFSDYRKLFGVSLMLVDESESGKSIPRVVEFSRHECVQFQDSEVTCKSDFGGIPHQLTLKPKQGVAIGKTETVFGDKILYTLQCQSLL